MARTKKQHIVPQCYLKRFSDDGEGIHAFDKFSRQVFPAKIADVAQKRVFYDINPDLFEMETDPQVIEKFLSGLEGLYPAALDAIEASAHTDTITPDVREAIAFFIQLQVSRTREFRERMIEVFGAGEAAFRERAARDGFKGELPDLSHLAAFRPEHAATWQGILLGNPTVVMDLAAPLLDMIWILGANNTDELLYTSDNPVIRQAHKKSPLIGSGGWTAEGSEVQLPINPRLVLVLKERTFFAEQIPLDGKIVELNDDDVRYCNHLQVSNCWQQVYCSRPDFSTARRVCDDYPELCEEGRHRLNFVE